MRKDVRIGLSIGGVLLAVLIVYLLVPKDANNNQNTQKVAQNGGGTSGGTSTQPGGDASGTGGQGGNNAVDSGQSLAHGGGSTTPGSSVDSGTAPPQQDPSVASRGAGGMPGVDGVPSTGSSDQPAQPAAGGGGVDWATILNQGVMPESMMATKRDPFADDNAKHAVDTPRNTPGPQPDWTNTGTTSGGSGAQTGGGTGQTAVTHPPTAPTPAPTGSTGIAAGAPKDHTIQRGETFSSIALAAYGDPKYWKEIKKANPAVDDTKLKPGMVVKVPDSASVKAAHTPVAGNQPANGIGGTGSTKVEAPVDPSREYRVQPSDSLHKIALKLYGKASKADSIYELNREKIGGDSARIKVGMVLKLPEAPTLSPTAKR